MKWSNRTAGEAHTVHYGHDCRTGQRRSQMELPQCLLYGYLPQWTQPSRRAFNPNQRREGDTAARLPSPAPARHILHVQILETLRLLSSLHRPILTLPLRCLVPPVSRIFCVLCSYSKRQRCTNSSPTSKARFLKRLSGNLNISCVDFPLGQIFVQEDDF